MKRQVDLLSTNHNTGPLGPVGPAGHTAATHVVLLTHAGCPDGQACEYVLQTYLQRHHPHIPLQVITLPAEWQKNPQLIQRIRRQLHPLVVLIIADLELIQVFHWMWQVWDLVVIDHHPETQKLKQQKSKRLGCGQTCMVIWAQEYCAAELVYFWLYGKLHDIPLSLRLVSAIDLHKKQASQFQAVAAYLTFHNLWQIHMFQTIDQMSCMQWEQLILQGQNVQYWNQERWRQDHFCSFQLAQQWKGISVVAVCLENFKEATSLADYLFLWYPQVQVVFLCNIKCHRFSLRSKWDTTLSGQENQSRGYIDVQKVAQQFQGGGHRSAAAFQLTPQKSRDLLQCIAPHFLHQTPKIKIRS